MHQFLKRFLLVNISIKVILGKQFLLFFDVNVRFIKKELQ